LQHSQVNLFNIKTNLPENRLFEARWAFGELRWHS